MSGFEVAGLVLGAFPVAISALEKYREVATRFGLFFKIRLEYKRALDNLQIHQLIFTKHLRQLLLPLVVDDDKIEDLLKNPGGPAWREQAIAEMLEKRLQDSFPLYMSCIEELQRVMKDLNHELALESDIVQGKLNTPRASTQAARFISTMNTEGRGFQRYRIKFSNGVSVRERLFAELQDCNDKLEKLLDSSDKDNRLIQTRTTTMRAAAIDASICKFWVQARRIWKALSVALNCRCPQHEAKLLLQHRTSKRFEVQVIFAKLSSLSQWEMCKTRIAEGDGMMATIRQESVQFVDDTPIRQIMDSSKSSLKSSLKGKSSTTTKTALPRPPPSITFTSVQNSSHVQVTEPITNLCSALEQPDGSCCGYLTEDDLRYYVYTIHRRQAETVPSVSLDKILKGEVLPQPTRTQRYVISLILASSFLQLLESPWMPASFKEKDILFYSDPQKPNMFILDQPHITRQLSADRMGAPEEVSPFTDALDHLGIILLELCFGRPLEEQPYRKRWPAGGNARETAVFDVMAARDWQCHVNEEAGFDYAEAVGWCLGGNRSAMPDRWREDMVQKVIQPLQRCRDYLSGSEAGVGASS